MRVNYRNFSLIFLLLIGLLTPVTSTILWSAPETTNTWSKKNLDQLLSTKKKVVLYTLSAGMPLSLAGLPLVQKAAEKEGFHLQVVNDPLLPVEIGNIKIPVLEKSSYYLERGLFHHFPSTTVFVNGVQCGATVPGYKDQGAFFELIKTRGQNCGEGLHTQNLLSGSPTQEQILKSAQLVRETVLPRPIKYYYRPIDNEWVTYHDMKLTALFNRFTGEEIIFQGRYDSVATPDARYMTLPSPLRFFSMEAIFQAPETAKRLPPVFSDPSMMDSYQSLGIVSPNRYRAITAWSLAVAFRDYLENPENTETPIEAQEEKQNVCGTGTELATPILSKDGLYMGGLVQGVNKSNTMHVIQIGESGTECQVKLDVGMRTGKLDFSFDHQLITYMALDTDRNNLGTFVQNFHSGEITRVSAAGSKDELTFPSFLPNGNVLVLKVIKIDPQNKQYVIQEYQL